MPLLDELITDAAASAETIAAREGCSMRKINMTISLAFLAPGLVKAAIEGRLPYGMGVARLSDLPPEWPRQYQMLGRTGKVADCRVIEVLADYTHDHCLHEDHGAVEA